jgi:hypothetical protein
MIDAPKIADLVENRRALGWPGLRLRLGRDIRGFRRGFFTYADFFLRDASNPAGVAYL